MAPDAHTSVPARPAGPDLQHCPHCRGAVRPGAPWCTQCWTDLRPAPAPQAAPEPPPAPATVPPATAPLAASGATPPGEPGPTPAARPGGWPCSACGHANAVELDACAACGTGFLAAVRSSAEPLLVVPGLGDVARLSRAQRIGAAVLVAALFALAVLLLGLLLG